jgi:murein DD-endopeptidase MepM/ murein hydrolase activator NlpD
MSCVLELLRVRSWPRAATLALITIGVAGCSSEATRFGEYPYEATGSISPAQAAPVGRIESQPLPPYAAQPATYQSASIGSGVSGDGRGVSSFSPASHGRNTVRSNASPGPEITGSLTPGPAVNGRWSRDGGTFITVAQGDTIDSIARRYGVPASSIIQANNLAPPLRIHAGQQLVIPRYSASPLAGATHRAGPAPAMNQAGNPGVHVVASGETLSRIARRYGKPAGDIARANNIQASAALKIGDRLVIPGARTSAAQPKGAPAQATPPLAQTKAAAAAPGQGEAAPTATLFTPVTAGANDAGKSAESSAALPKFRWPANGRVIASYGPSSTGQKNDGINIAVPENTPIKAAEEGVVAYAGNELKGYGNLVLVRHPNGYVTAYAHAKELLVKRGDQIKRGQVIARSGQTGNVNAPQLHFEIRKGASPLDPMKFLGG